MFSDTVLKSTAISAAQFASSTARIEVRFRVDGWHCWPDAPERRKYLRDLHRHIFHISVATLVTHDDREIEFHDLIEQSNAIVQRMKSPAGSFGRMSCEQIARTLGMKLMSAHSRGFVVSVFEDGEAGAVVTLDLAPTK